MLLDGIDFWSLPTFLLLEHSNYSMPHVFQFVGWDLQPWLPSSEMFQTRTTAGWAFGAPDIKPQKH